MVFFQGLLLLGYLYAYGLHSRLSPRRQAIVHTALLAASLALLPVLPDPSWKPTGAENPSLRILGLLAATIGMPYFLLSTTSPLLQAWYSRARPGATPYRLFALSNLASMVALLSYPPLIEPNLPTRLQGQVWSVGYGGFALLCAALSWRKGNPVAETRNVDESDALPPGWKLCALWLSLAACASILLLAVTAYLTQDVAAIPFLWILPLAAYLLSFILCFEMPRFYQRAQFLPLLAAALAVMVYLQMPDSPRLKVGPKVAIFVTGLFVCCMVCHGELAALRPHPRHLTLFYVMVSLGGVIGGVFVGLVAPNVFNSDYEFPIGLGLCATLAVAALMRRRKPWLRAGLAALLAGYFFCLGLVVRHEVEGFRVVERNFYGRLRVEDVGVAGQDDAYRKLVHGMINHGEQMLNETYRRSPISYFCPDSGIGRAMRTRRDGETRRIGILGLGCGTLAAYGRPGDTIRIYEINPLVLSLAQGEFSYLRDTPAKVEVALGDGRLVLEQEPGQQFDILVMDAFSGDSVPVHLITREAFQTYFRHLKPGGIVAVNISNKYLDLQPVMESAAAHFGKIALSFSFTAGDDDFLCFSNQWVLVVDPSLPGRYRDLLGAGQVLRGNRGFRVWTDDFSDMYRILRWRRQEL